jgi:hypothetical protein
MAAQRMIAHQIQSIPPTIADFLPVPLAEPRALPDVWVCNETLAIIWYTEECGTFQETSRGISPARAGSHPGDGPHYSNGRTDRQGFGASISASQVPRFLLFLVSCSSSLEEENGRAVETTYPGSLNGHDSLERGPCSMRSSFIPDLAVFPSESEPSWR